MAGSLIQLAGQFVLLSHQLFQAVLIFVPVGNLFAGYAGFHGSFGYGHGDFGNQARVYRFWDEIFRSESQVVHMVSFVDHVGHRFLGQSGDGTYGSQFHFFIDGSGTGVEGTTENVGESDDVVDLVRIVGTSRRHQYVRAGSHSVFVGDFRSRVGQGEDNRMGGHAAHHILCQDVSSGQSEEYIGAFDGFCQGVDVGTVGGKEFFLFVQVGTLLGDDSLAVEHDNVFQTGAQ